MKISADEPCPCGSGKIFGECHQPLVRSPEPQIKRHVRLQPVPQPAPGTVPVFEHIGEGTLFFIGMSSDISYDCGQCSSSLMAGIEAGSVSGIILKCSTCGTYNLSEPAKSS